MVFPISETTQNTARRPRDLERAHVQAREVAAIECSCLSDSRGATVSSFDSLIRRSRSLGEPRANLDYTRRERRRGVKRGTSLTR